MADQQALNATFFALRKRPEGGGVLLGASISFFITMLVLVGIFFGALWLLLGQDLFTFSQQMAATAGKDGAGAAQSLPPNFGRIFLIFPIEMIWLFFVFVLLASFESSCLRWMIRGERSAPLNLCFGADMWRVYGTYWAWFLYFTCTGILFWIVMLVVGVIGASAGGANNPALAGVLVLVACLAWIVGWIYVTVRLAPAAAASIGAGHFAPLKAWSASRGRFWALFGAFLLLMIIYVVAAMVVGGVTLGSFYMSIFSHLDMSQMQTDPASFSRSYNEAALQAMRDMMSNPATMALYFGGQIVLYAVGLVFYILFYGVNARAVEAALEDGKLTHAPAAS